MSLSPQLQIGLSLQRKKWTKCCCNSFKSSEIKRGPNRGALWIRRAEVLYISHPLASVVEEVEVYNRSAKFPPLYSSKECKLTYSQKTRYAWIGGGWVKHVDAVPARGGDEGKRLNILWRRGQTVQSAKVFRGDEAVRYASCQLLLYGLVSYRST